MASASSFALTKRKLFPRLSDAAPILVRCDSLPCVYSSDIWPAAKTPLFARQACRKTAPHSHSPIFAFYGEEILSYWNIVLRDSPPFGAVKCLSAPLAVSGLTYRSSFLSFSLWVCPASSLGLRLSLPDSSGLPLICLQFRRRSVFQIDLR